MKVATYLAVSIAALPIAASAIPIFSEDFESASGAAPFGGDADFNSTEREGGRYHGPVTVPGWTLTNQFSMYIHEGASGNTALLLNESASHAAISRTISGLIAGAVHTLTFEFWGDNELAGSSHNFSYEINGVTNAVNRQSTGLRTGNFGTVSFDFTPTSGSTLLRIREVCCSGVVLDNIAITANVQQVPEPATIWLFGAALTGFLAFRRRRV